MHRFVHIVYIETTVSTIVFVKNHACLNLSGDLNFSSLHNFLLFLEHWQFFQG